MDNLNYSGATINSYSKTSLALHALGLCSLTCYAAMLAALDFDRAILSFLSILSILSVLFILACALLNRQSRLDSSKKKRLSQIVVFWALCFRALFAFLAPANDTPLSTDIHRYLWEGSVVRAGGNPYSQAPNDIALQELLPELKALNQSVAHRELSSIYPPGAQLLFSFLPSTIEGFRTCAILLESTCLLLIWHWLSSTHHLIPLRLLWYAWLPLPLIEISFSGHLEALFLPLIVLALSLYDRGKGSLLPACLLAAATSIKYVAIVPLGFLGFFSLRDSSWPTQFLLFLLPLLVFAVLFIPYLDAELSIFSSLQTYGEHWRFNGALFQLLELVFSNLGDGAWLAKFFSAVLCLGLGIYLLIRRRSVLDSSILSFACVLLLSPTVYPWYLLWFAVLLPLSTLPNATNCALLTFCLTSLYSYEVLSHPNDWALSPAMLAFEYGLPLLVYFSFTRIPSLNTSRTHSETEERGKKEG